MTRDRLNELLSSALNETLDIVAKYSDADVRDVLERYTSIQSTLDYESRWWNEYTTVVQLSDTFISFTVASTTGDRSANECGYEPPNLLDDLTEVKAVTRTITVYE